MKTVFTAAALVLAAAAAGPQAFAGQPAGAGHAGPASKACFRPNQAIRYATPDEQRVYLRTITGDVFEFQLAGRCPNIRAAGQIGFVAPMAVSERICEGQSVQVVVPTTLGTPLNCQAARLRRLTPDEARALPDPARP